jgi:hypothetical protein
LFRGFSGKFREFSGIRFRDFQGIKKKYTSFKFLKQVVQVYFQEIFKTISPDLKVFRTNQGILRGSIQGFSGD